MNFLYQAYGPQYIINQTIFSIISLLRFFRNSSGDDGIKIFVYTDKPETLTPFFQNEKAVHIVSVSMDQIKKWRGTIDFVHRVKLEIIKDCLSRVNSKLMYLDGDTIFIQDPLPLFNLIGPDKSVMHECEYSLEKPVGILGKKMTKFAKGAGKEFKIPLGISMWNAGVIGFDLRNKDFVDQALLRTDRMYAVYGKHVIEQLAVSWILQEKGKIRDARNEIWHYWDAKDIVQAKIDEILKNKPLMVDGFDFVQFANQCRREAAEGKKRKTFLGRLSSFFERTN